MLFKERLLVNSLILLHVQDSIDGSGSSFVDFDSDTEIIRVSYILSVSILRTVALSQHLNI